MERAAVFIFFFILGGCSTWSNLDRVESGNERSVASSPTSPTSINLNFQADDRATLDCTFDDQVVHQCLLDTGNPSAILVPSARKNIFVDRPSVKLTKSPRRGCAFKQINSLRLSGIDFPKAVGQVCEDARETGNVGLWTLGPAIWKFDMISGQLSVVEKIPDGLVTDKLWRDQEGLFGHIAISVQLGTSKIIAALDTGAQISFIDESTFKKNSRGFTDSGFSYRGSVVVNGISMPVRAAWTVDFSRDQQYGGAWKSGWRAVLGQDFIRNHVWFFDLKNNSWAVAP